MGSEERDEQRDEYQPEDDSEEVVADEMMTDHFGSFAWPSSQILQSLLLSNRDLVQGKTVLELGCGIGIDGIFASKWAKWVYLTDLGEPSSILENCRRNCEKNHCENVTIVELSYCNQCSCL